MRLVERVCPDPMGKEKAHSHYSLRGRRVAIFWTLWRDYDRRNFGHPIELNIHTATKYYLIRPFSKSRAYDWRAEKWTGTPENGYDDIVWRHVVSSPQRSKIWDRVHG